MDAVFKGCLIVVLIGVGVAFLAIGLCYSLIGH
jgi:hypothetical protein